MLTARKTCIPPNLTSIQFDSLFKKKNSSWIYYSLPYYSYPQKRFYKHCIWESHHCHGHRVTSINAHFTVLHNSHTSRLNPSQRQNFWIQRDARNDKNTIKLAVTDTVKYGLQLWNIPLVIWLRLWVHTGCICACTHPSNPCPSIHSSRVLLSNWSRQVSPCL